MIISSYPNDTKALVNRAFCYAKIDDFQKAVEDYTHVLEFEPDNTHALYNRAISFDKMGRLNEVIYCFI
jgi:tetratricopeptide (TPR) repeat protein